MFLKLGIPFGKESLPNGRPSITNTGVFAKLTSVSIGFLTEWNSKCQKHLCFFAELPFGAIGPFTKWNAKFQKHSVKEIMDLRFTELSPEIPCSGVE